MKRIGIAGLVLAMFAATAFAEQDIDRGKMALDFSTALKKSVESLKKYNWKSRLSIQEAGEDEMVILSLVRFDASGELEKTKTGGTELPTPRPGLRGRRQRRENARRQELAEKIGKLLRSYAMPTTGTVVDFFEKAVILEGTGEMKGSLNIQGSKYIKPGDKVTLWLDSATKNPKKMSFQTKLDDASVQAEITYSLLKDGTCYPAKATLKMPGEKTQAVMENFNFVKQ